MRLASLSAPAQRNENHRLVRVVFTNNDLVNSRIMGVEQSIYFASGSSPVHAESPTEEIMYFRRGTGKVLLGNSYVDVRPGSAVAIPTGIEHHVVNSGRDVLEHILISAEIGDRKAEASYSAQPGDCLPEDQSRLLSRLECRRFTVAEDGQSTLSDFAGHESVYSLSSGFAIAHVQLAGTEYEWQYALDASDCMWIPPGVPHYFRNIGDTPLNIVQFQCRS
ncbi:cupin domain-containing protein [Ancylobacter aquaticus]|nr:cupin domain-containing protein [Ancylobacter aquaticus]